MYYHIARIFSLCYCLTVYTRCLGRFSLYLWTCCITKTAAARAVTSSASTAHSQLSSPSSSSVRSMPITPSTPKSTTLLTLEVSWEKMPPALLSALSREERPAPALRREMIRLICSDVYAVCPRPGRKQLRSLADKIVSRYPLSFRDMVGDQIVGSGSDSLLMQLEGRFDNLNRGKHPAVKRQRPDPATAGHSDEVSVSSPTPRDYYGCVSWQPCVPVGDALEDLQQKQVALQQLSTAMSPDLQVVQELMKDTYCLQRQDINEGHNALQLKQKWPFLFTSTGLDSHFTELTGVPLVQTVTQAYHRKAHSMMDFFKSSAKKFLPILAEIERAKAEVRNDTPEVIGLVMLLTTQFGEMFDGLVITKDVCHASH